MNAQDMPVDDVLTPISGDIQSTIRSNHVSPLALATFLCVALLVSLVGWISLAGNPAGGQPYVILAMSTAEKLDDGDYEVLMGDNGVPIPRQKPASIGAEAQDVRPLSATSNLPNYDRSVPDFTSDGVAPMKAFANPFPANESRPRVAIVLRGLGLSQSATQLAIDTLPANVTLSFVPYPKNLQSWVSRARAAGHEVLIELPMEPVDYPNNDPGPNTLLTSLSTEENAARLDWLLNRFSGYVGVSNYLGSKFVHERQAFQPVLAALQRRGLLYLDDGTSQRTVLTQVARDIGLVWSLSDRELNYASAAAIELDLNDLEARARRNGFAIGTGFSFPVTIEQVTKWAATLKDKGIVLAPITAVSLPPA